MARPPTRQNPRAEAELEALRRITAVRDILDGLLIGHMPLDPGLLLDAVHVLDQAGAWCLTAEQAARREADAA